jgi:uncharacterized pyridoxamine 5'-phosphate oxidase family protein
MDIKELFEKIMATGTDMAFATSVENIPNVRILNYIYSKNDKIMYFQSRKGSQKGKEIEENKNVAFTTIRKDGMSYVRVNHAVAKKSEKTIYDLKDKFSEKMPFYKEFIEHHGNFMDVYEVHFSKVEVWPNPDKFEEIKI